MTNDRIMRQVTSEQDKLLRILEALHYATVENIKMKDRQIWRMELRITVDFNDPEGFKKVIEELRTIPL